MRIGRIGEIGLEKPIVEVDGAIYDASTLVKEIDGRFFESGGVERLRSAVEQHLLPSISLPEGTRIGSPIAKPGAIYCIGMNYAAHAAESGSEPPKNLVMFMKAPNTVVGPNDVIQIPKTSTKTDWEVELAVVIGKTTSYLDSPEDAKNHIAGFTVANDLSERDFQLAVSGGQWSKGKSSPGFCPLGPWLVPTTEIDYQNLQLKSWVNGEARQDSNTSDQIFPVDYAVWHLSQFLTLDPGDLILTGTPEGVALSERFPYISAGDVVEIEIEGIGRQRQEYINA
ncbi:MAG: fumarylacetoacetate hydrolase family protein [Aurantimicrobium sp.]|uniref:fumarylacetoacetate hydrolase family protein n=1 Tax=Aurantimicrobium sp. TaxID=1930784 RepID=UPI002FC9B6B7